MICSDYLHIHIVAACFGSHAIYTIRRHTRAARSRIRTIRYMCTRIPVRYRKKVRHPVTQFDGPSARGSSDKLRRHRTGTREGIRERIPVRCGTSKPLMRAPLLRHSYSFSLFSYFLYFFFFYSRLSSTLHISVSSSFRRDTNRPISRHSIFSSMRPISTLRLRMLKIFFIKIPPSTSGN